MLTVLFQLWPIFLLKYCYESTIWPAVYEWNTISGMFEMFLYFFVLFCIIVRGGGIAQVAGVGPGPVPRAAISQNPGRWISGSGFAVATPNGIRWKVNRVHFAQLLRREFQNDTSPMCSSVTCWNFNLKQNVSSLKILHIKQT